MELFTITNCVNEGKDLILLAKNHFHGTEIVFTAQFYGRNDWGQPLATVSEKEARRIADALCGMPYETCACAGWDGMGADANGVAIDCVHAV